MDETRIRALVEKAFKAGFDWCLSGIDRYGSYNGGPIADGLTRFLELEAALQAASPVPRVEWQPIETAPVGTQVWAWDDERGSNPAMLVDGEWHITYDDAIIHPKYWQPLPDPLARKTERGAPSGV
jgi:hypothetical protein